MNGINIEVSKEVAWFFLVSFLSTLRLKKLVSSYFIAFSCHTIHADFGEAARNSSKCPEGGTFLLLVCLEGATICRTTREGISALTLASSWGYSEVMHELKQASESSIQSFHTNYYAA